MISVWWLVAAVVLLGGVALLAVLDARRTRARVRGLQDELTATRTELERISQQRWPGRTRQVARTAAKVVTETAGRLRQGGVTGLLASSLDDLTRWVRDDRTEIARLASRDGTLTVMFSDIVGSTELNERLGDARWVKELRTHDALVRAEIERHRGHVVKNQGDGYMVVFPSALGGVEAALGLQRRLSETRRRIGPAIGVRIGLHIGPVVSRQGDFFGRNVALAARVAAYAEGGETLVTDPVREAVEQAPHGQVVFTDPVTVDLKGLAGEHRLWRADSA